MKPLNHKGFTLVELIIVITILAILSSIAFVSYSGYIKKAKLTKIQSNIVNLDKGLNLYLEKTGKYPLSSSNIEISYNSQLLGYQGEYTKMEYQKIGLDDISETKIEYSTDVKQQKIKILSFLDENLLSNINFVENTYAVLGKEILVGGGNYYYVLDENDEKLTSNTDIGDGLNYNLYYNQENKITGSGILFSEIDKITDTKDFEYLKNVSNIDNFLSGKNIVFLRRITSSNSIYNYLISTSANVIDLSSTTFTIEDIVGYNPDLIVCDSIFGNCNGDYFNTLYDMGYNILTYGNDTVDNIYLIEDYYRVNNGVNYGLVYSSSTNHFLERGWSSTTGSNTDARIEIKKINDSVKVIGYTDANTPVFLLYEVNGKWFHNQTYNFNTNLLKRVLVYLLTY